MKEAQPLTGFGHGLDQDELQSSFLLMIKALRSSFNSIQKQLFLFDRIGEAKNSNTTEKKGYYSLHGHVGIMAREVQRGANSVQGVEATLWQVPETLSEKILEKMKAPPKEGDVAVIKPEQLLEADGFLFGFPSRFGMMSAQCKAFFDATHEIWATQSLAGKPAGIFWSTGFHGGGQENTALTAITQLAHHGMLFVPLGYTFGEEMFEMSEVKGGSPYGAGTYAGDGSRLPSELELKQAFYQGQYVAGITKKLKVQEPSPDHHPLAI